MLLAPASRIFPSALDGQSEFGLIPVIHKGARNDRGIEQACLAFLCSAGWAREWAFMLGPTVDGYTGSPPIR
jgi:hypothetical protein